MYTEKTWLSCNHMFVRCVLYLASIITLCSQYHETKFGHMSTFLSIILHHFVLNIIGHFFETKFGHMSTKQKQLCEVYFLTNPSWSTMPCLGGITSYGGALEFIVDVDVIDRNSAESLRQPSLHLRWLVNHCLCKVGIF